MRKVSILLFLILLTEGVPAQFRRDESRVSSSLLKEKGWSGSSTVESAVRTSEGTADSAVNQLQWVPFDAATIGVQARVSLGGAAIVGGIAMGIAAGSVQNRGINSLAAGLTILIVGSVATAVAIPTGVYYGGEWMGGNGSYAWTMIAGASASALTALPLVLRGDIKLGTLVTLFLVSGLTGSILGYHLSASPVYESDGGATDIPGMEDLDGISMNFVLIRF